MLLVAATGLVHLEVPDDEMVEHLLGSISFHDVYKSHNTLYFSNLIEKRFIIIA